MKVSNSLPKALQQKEASSTRESSVRQAGKNAVKNARSAMGDTAQVSLSAKAKQIQKATDLAKGDQVDEAKIAHFQNLIDGGKYQVDAARVADKLINEHLKMPT